MTLDPPLRVALEEAFDSFIREPKKYEKGFSTLLRMVGIEPNLDSILSFISGCMYGCMIAYYRNSYRRSPTKEEYRAFNEWIKRRAWELRQAFIGTRIEEPSEDE